VFWDPHKTNTLWGQPKWGVKVQLYSFFNLDAGWGWWLTPRPDRFTPGKWPSTHCTGGPRPLWTGAENLVSIRIRSPDRPALGESLYRLSYRGPQVCNQLYEVGTSDTKQQYWGAGSQSSWNTIRNGAMKYMALVTEHKYRKNSHLSVAKDTCNIRM
jgi:hypothetical protein